MTNFKTWLESNENESQEFFNFLKLYEQFKSQIYEIEGRLESWAKSAKINDPTLQQIMHQMVLTIERLDYFLKFSRQHYSRASALSQRPANQTESNQESQNLLGLIQQTYQAYWPVKLALNAWANASRSISSQNGAFERNMAQITKNIPEFGQYLLEMDKVLTRLIQSTRQ